jgi:iron complex transport system substrate-binding protein
MKVNEQDILSRPGWSSIGAIRNRHLYEIQSGCILQPGPAALTEGVRQIHAILAGVVGVKLTLALQPIQKSAPRLL